MRRCLRLLNKTKAEAKAAATKASGAADGNTAGGGGGANVYPRQYFPIRNRVVDHRVSGETTVSVAQVTRRREELRTEVDTGVTRQSSGAPWSARIRPTHFLSLRLPQTNSFVSNAQHFFDEVRFANSHVAPLFIPVQKLHVTISVMTLPETDNKSTAVCETVKRLCDGCAPLLLRFQGLGTFNHNRVLFSRVVSEGGFTALDGLVSRTRGQLGGGPLSIDIKGNPHDSYVPHITLAKVRPSQAAQFPSGIPISVWAPFQFSDFGEVLFDTVDLCEMKTDEKTGYYRTVDSFKLLGRK